MENENVEYNEVKCKTLILGDEETGFINLKVRKLDDSPVIEINSSDSVVSLSTRNPVRSGLFSFKNSLLMNFT